MSAVRKAPPTSGASLPFEAESSGLKGKDDSTPKRGSTVDPETPEDHFPDEAPRLRVGSSRCQCAACGRFFGGVVGCDLHQVLVNGEVVCLGDDDLRRRGLRLSKGWWVRSYRGVGIKSDVDGGVA
jgi:hypothetical protein